MNSKDIEVNADKLVEVEEKRDSSPESTSLRATDEAPTALAPQFTFPEGGLKAWSVVAGAAGVVFCNFGYVNAFGVYQEYYETHQLSHESPSNIAWIGSLQIFLLFGGVLFGGPLFDRYGEKIIYAPIITYLFSVFMTSLCKELWQFILCQGLLGGVSMGLLMGPSMAACGHYFRKKRGAAMGLTIAGSSLGGVIFPIALSRMFYNTNLSFGWSVRVVAFVMLAVLIPSALMIRARLPPRKGQFFLPAAFKEPLYVSILASVWFIMFGLFTPFFYLPTLAVEHGMSEQLSSYLVAILNATSFFGRVIPGILADKLGTLNLTFVAAISTGVLVLCLQAIHTNAGFIVFAALFGFTSGAIVSLVALAYANVPKNPQNIGTYIGMAMGFSSIATLIGPPINGVLVTKYNGFGPALDLSGVCILIGSSGLLISRHLAGKGFFAKV